MKKYIYFLLMLTVLACEKSPTSANKDYSNYFPLELDNQWTFTSETAATLQTHRIWDTGIFQDRLYSLWGSAQNNTVPLRYENGKIYRVQKSVKLMWFDFNKADQETYTYSPTDNINYTVTVSRELTVEYGDHLWTDCIQFAFDDSSMADEEISYTLAPDIGIVHISGAWINLYLTDYVLHE